MSKPIKNIQLFNNLCAIEETLISRGWCQDRIIDDAGRVCIMGAVVNVVPYDKDWCILVEAIESAIPTALPVTGFNDDPATTFDDVLGVIRKAREALVAS